MSGPGAVFLARAGRAFWAALFELVQLGQQIRGQAERERRLGGQALPIEKLERFLLAGADVLGKQALGGVAVAALEGAEDTAVMATGLVHDRQLVALPRNAEQPG